LNGTHHLAFLLEATEIHTQFYHSFPSWHAHNTKNATTNNNIMVNTYGSIIMNNDGLESGGVRQSKKLGGTGLVDDGSSSYSLANGGSHQQNLTFWSPSPHSTSRSSRENLDLLLQSRSPSDTSTEDDSVALLANAGTTSLLCECSNGKNSKALEPEGRCSAVTSFLARHGSRRNALLGLGLLVACSLYVVGRYSNTTTIPLLVGPNHHTSSSTTVTTSKQRGGKKKSMAALSLLDPVMDLGLAAYERPKSSRPPKALADSPYTVYPTNAWYQNLLMLGKDGDDHTTENPQDIHRVYCIPYIIDAAGKIAGLRLHGSYRTVSNTVIQLNTQNEFGLTIGAKVHHGDVVEPTKDDPDNEKPTTISRGYTIHTATPLGVTLAWVRFFFFFR
jgi:hypothetical protein